METARTFSTLFSDAVLRTKLLDVALVGDFKQVIKETAVKLSREEMAGQEMHENIKVKEVFVSLCRISTVLGALVPWQRYNL